MSNNLLLIIRREYLERVAKKSFIITTLLMPLLMLALGAAPTLIMILGEDDNTTFNVIDDSGVIVPALAAEEGITFKITDMPVDSALSKGDIDGVIVIPADVVATGSGVKLYSTDGVGMATEQQLRSLISRAVENQRIKGYEIDNLSEIMEQVHCDIGLQSIRLDNDKGEKSSSTLVSFILGYVLTFVLYIALMLYGQMVMTGIIEEKSNRVLELIVSSVKPFQLLLGKIAGIGLVAVTQIVVWLVLTVAISALVIPALIPADVMSEMNALNAGTLDRATSTVDIELLQSLSLMADPWYIFSLFSYLLLFLAGGFLLYAGLYAAIGSAVDNIQDASQLQSIIIVPIILGIIFGMQAASSPTSTLAEVMSFIPFTSPMVMMARIPFGIPAWQIAVSWVILMASVIAMIWIAAKIYRVGIFMYGKKPSLKELIRWARYK